MPIVTGTPDADFERRWVAWKARGLAHERIVRRQFVASATVIAVIALGVLIAYALRSL